MTRPRLLDLFCCQGGAAMGYHRAGFDVVGVDVAPQPRYPFEFVRADALEYFAAHGREFDAIHASPPCQAYSRTRNLPWVKGHAELVPQTLALLCEVGRPWIVENVPGAPMERWMPVVICGTQLGLRVRRHRLFASSMMLMAPAEPCRHRDGDMTVAGNRHGVIGTRHSSYVGGDGQTRFRTMSASRAVAAAAMGCGWMTRAGLSQAIPPAYTEFVGRQLLDFLEG